MKILNVQSRKTLRAIMFVMVASFITACGGGGGGDGDAQPQVNAGADQTVMSASSVTLTGSASGGRPPFTYAWSQTAGSTVSLSGTAMVNPGFTAPTVTAATSEVLTFELSVTDANGNSSTDQVNVTISDQAPAPPPPPTSGLRPTMIEYDYDNNGVTDAISTLSYDENGRVVRDEYANTGDGTPDLFDLFDNEAEILNEFTYDGNGRLASNKRMDSNSTLEFIYSYNGSGQVSRVDITVESVVGIVGTYSVYTYNGNLAQQADLFLASNDVLQLTEQYRYDADGQVTQDLGLFTTGVAAYERQYTWDANNRLDFFAFDRQADGIFEATSDYIFDATSGLLVQRINVNTDQFAQPFDNFTETFIYDANNQLDMVEYDNNNDGSIDAVGRITQRESGPCVAVYIPLISTQAGQDGIPGSNVGDIGWCQ